MAGLTAVQFAWKKDAENSSGPGALSGWIEKRTFLISASVGMLVSLAFVSWLIRGERAFWTTSSPTVPIDAKISSKYRATSTAICSSSYTGKPSGVSRTVSLLRAFRPFDIAWKKPVFLSPRVSHKSLLLCF